MRARLLVVAAVAVLAWAAQAVGGDATADDLKKFQGTWRVVSVNGKTSDEETQVTFTGNHFSVQKGKDYKEEGTVRLDASKNPKHIDLLSADKEVAKLGPIPGIYKLEGDTLTVTFGPVAGKKDIGGKEEVVPSKRPTDFSTGKIYPVLVFKRVTK